MAPRLLTGRAKPWRRVCRSSPVPSLSLFPSTHFNPTNIPNLRTPQLCTSFRAFAFAVLECPFLTYLQGLLFHFLLLFVQAFLNTPGKLETQPLNSPYSTFFIIHSTHCHQIIYIFSCLFVYCLGHFTRIQLYQGRSLVFFCSFKCYWLCRMTWCNVDIFTWPVAKSVEHKQLTAESLSRSSLQLNVAPRPKVILLLYSCQHQWWGAKVKT